MVNQMLFGELCQIFDSTEEWYFISLTHDNYQGWILKKQIKLINEENFKSLHSKEVYHSLELTQHIKSINNDHLYPIILGSTIYAKSAKEFHIADFSYAFEGNTSEPQEKIDRIKIIEYAYLYLHAPYLWGGRSPMGIDCSGLTQMAYKIAGVNILRDASQQATLGDTISFLSEAKKGDLAFFDNAEEEIVHVGILISDTNIIHASENVRIDHIDHQGIFSYEEKKYTHNLRLIKSIL
jgi:cell wall-associated NlpC family hydrolase